LDAVGRDLIDVAGRALNGPLPDDPATALQIWLSRAWALLQAHPALLNPALFAEGRSSKDTVASQAPVLGGLRAILERLSRDHADRLGVDWLLAAVLALGHAATDELAVGRMTSQRAGEAFISSAVRVCIPDDSSRFAAPE
jgi:hypothetical protein